MTGELIVECIEAKARPLRRTVTTSSGKEIAIYTLQGELLGGPGLRQTVLLRQDEHPPVGSRLAMWLQVLDDGLVINDVSRGINVEVVRATSRSRVVAGMRLGRSAQLELRLPGQALVRLTLAVASNVGQGASVTVSGGRKPGNVQYSADNVWWPITDTKGILVTLGVRIRDAIRDRLRWMGVDGRVFTFAAGLLVAGLTMGYLAWSESRARAAAETRATSAEEAVEMAQAAREASLQAELVCISDRQKLAARLGDLREATRLAATEALQLTASNTLAAERGGRALRSSGLQDLDLVTRDALIEQVIGSIPLDTLDHGACVAQTAALGLDVPLYLLTWHPDSSLACPQEYRSVRSGQNLAGPWGLSQRFAREFGDRGDQSMGTTDPTGGVLADPRDEARWAAHTLAGGYRTVIQRLLRDQGAGRPAALPSQLQLWSLALTDAYNNMASPAAGAVDRSADECVSALLALQAQSGGPAPPDTPVLPDLVDVLTSRQTVAAPPTAGCPWSNDGIVRSASRAVLAVGRMAALRRDGAFASEDPR